MDFLRAICHLVLFYGYPRFLRVVVEDFVQSPFVRRHRCLVVLYQCTRAEREVTDFYLNRDPSLTELFKTTTRHIYCKL